MKRFFILSLCVLILSTSVGCDSASLKSGYYYMVGDYEEAVTPYVNLDVEDKSFAFGEGLILSYAEYGSFKIKGERITATTQNTTFVFEIKDPSTIILIDCREYESFADYEGAQFAYHVDV